MSTNFDGTLTYRDYVVHIFTGILFNVFLLAVFWPQLPSNWWKYDLHNEFIWALAAIPVLFLEGHFILAFNRFFHIELFKMAFIISVKRYRKKKKKESENNNNTHKDKIHADVFPCKFVEHHYKEVIGKKDDSNNNENSKNEQEIHYRKAAYKLRIKWEDNLWDQHKWLFVLLFYARRNGQKIIRKDKDGPIIKTTDENKLEVASRYYVLSDFFKGICCSSIITFIIALFTHRWWIAVAMFIVFIFSWLRERCFSMLYVKTAYAKKKKTHWR